MYNIMVVDPDPVSGEELKTQLRAEGFAVSLVNSGKDALKRLEGLIPDILILNIELADMDGLEVLKKVKSNDKTSNMPVIALSYKDDKADQTVALDAGAGDFMVKPFSFRELSARIRSQVKYVMNRSAAIGVNLDDKSAVEDKIVVKHSDREINFAGNSILLGKREFDILSRIMKDGRDSVPHNNMSESLKTILGVPEKSMDSSEAEN